MALKKALSQKNTYCPKLWEEFFIVEDGTVFPCCQRPCKVGNLYQDKLRKIYNSLEFQKMRENSLKGKLKCYKSCTLLHKDKIKPRIRPVKADYLKDIKKLRLLFSEKCNLNCVMCHQNSQATEVLDLNIIKKNIDLTPFRFIDSQGGEPFFIRQANQFFDYAVKKGKKVSLLTNGMLINDLWAGKVALHSDYIHVSLNAATKKTHEAINRGSSWERVLENVQKLRKAKEKHGTGLNILGHMTLVLRNLDEIPSFIDKFGEFGFDSINFGFAKSVKYYLKLNPFKRKKLKRKIKEAIERSKKPDKIDTLRLELIDLA